MENYLSIKNTININNLLTYIQWLLHNKKDAMKELFSNNDKILDFAKNKVII